MVPIVQGLKVMKGRVPLEQFVVILKGVVLGF